MDYQKCQRCWTQKAIFRCPSCEKHQILCNKCDTYIHSMNKNKFHQRFGLSDNYKNIIMHPVSNKINNEIRKTKPKLRKINASKKKNKNLNKNENKSYDEIINNNDKNKGHKEAMTSGLNEFNNTNYINNTNNIFKRSKTFQLSNVDNISKNKINNFLEEKENQSDIFVYKYNSIMNKNEDKINDNTKYSNKSEIVNQKMNFLNSNQNFNDITNLYNSEQNFPYEVSLNNFNIKNNNDNSTNYESYKIKTKIEEVAKNMIGDMSEILSNITNEEQNFKNKCSELDIKYNNRLKEIEQTKDEIISNLKYKINEMHKNNEQLKQDLIKVDQEHNSKCQELVNMISILKNKINDKEEELYHIKNQLNEEEKADNDNNENDKNNLCYQYEEKINNILNLSDENQKKLLDIIKEKERIIQELINANQNKTYNYNNLINKFKRENEEFKDVTQRSIYLAGNNVYNKFLNELDTKSYKYQQNYYK